MNYLIARNVKFVTLKIVLPIFVFGNTIDSFSDF